MLSLIIQISIISIIFIFLVHHLLCFFKTTLTVPKIKDLVNSPTTKYQHIFDTISHTNTNTNITLDTDPGSDYSVIDLLPSDTNTDNSMKDELKNFLKKQLNNDDLSFTNSSNNTNSNNNSSAYSPY
jgi:hypothetical protein